MHSATYIQLATFICSTLYIHAQEHIQTLQQANNALHHGHYTQAIDSYTTLLQHFPNHSGLISNIGYAYKKLHRYTCAIVWYQKALLYDPQNARLLRGISHAYLMIGDFKNGWPAYEYRWVHPPEYNAQFISFMHAGGNASGKTIIIHSEYGLGDVLQFIRYAQLLHAMGATIIVQSHKRLIPLLSLCPYIDQVLAPDAPLPHYDFRILVMSLPLAFNTTLDTIPHAYPYLSADPKLIEYWKKKVSTDNNYRIGICWQANMHINSDNKTVQDDAHAKSIPLNMLRPLTQIPHVMLYSLQQKSDKTVELEDSPIVYFDELDTIHGPFMDTAALMKNLDLIITVDTSIAHLAGALGIPTWILLPYHADWRWLEHRDSSPWYPSMTLFRQTKEDDWHPTIEIIVDTLTQKSRL